MSASINNARSTYWFDLFININSDSPETLALDSVMLTKFKLDRQNFDQVQTRQATQFFYNG